MRCANRKCYEELWQGTAKAAEGHLGLKVEVNWQHADSSSAKGFRYSFANEQESTLQLHVDLSVYPRFVGR